MIFLIAGVALIFFILLSILECVCKDEEARELDRIYKEEMEDIKKGRKPRRQTLDFIKEEKAKAAKNKAKTAQKKPRRQTYEIGLGKTIDHIDF